MYFVTGYNENNDVIFFTDYTDKALAEKRRESIEQADGCRATCEYKESPSKEDYQLWSKLCKINLDTMACQ